MGRCNPYLVWPEDNSSIDRLLRTFPRIVCGASPLACKRDRPHPCHTAKICDWKYYLCSHASGKYAARHVLSSHLVSGREGIFSYAIRDQDDPYGTQSRVMAILSSSFTQKIWYYVPAMVTSSVLTCVAGGLLSITNQAKHQSHWIEYECLYGFGTGMVAQTSNLAVQTVLPQYNISTGVALVFFAQQLGGTIFVSVGKNLLTFAMVTQLSNVADLDAQAISGTSLTDLRNVVPPPYLPMVKSAFNYDVIRAFLVAIGLSSGMFLASLMTEWKDIRVGGVKQ